MKFNRSRQETTIRREAWARARFRPGRARTLELLERREMLAGDVSAPWQNPLNPHDVNFDQRVSPLDALLIINDLAARGSHTLDAPAVAPLVATQNPPSLRYLDVSGDNRVSPLDALIVINELADVELMMVHTYPTDMSGNPISSIGEGFQYKLRTDVMDIRDPVSTTPGVFSAFDDVTFDSALSSIDVGQTVEFGSFFSLVRLSTLAQGRVIAGGAAQSLTPPGNAVQMLWSVVLTATNPGSQTLTQTFTPGFSTDPNHESLLYGGDNALLADEIQFVGATLSITSDLPTLTIGGVSQAENSGAPFNFTVTLSEAATQDVTVNFATTDGAGANGATTANNDYLPASGTLTFMPGQTTMVVPVTVVGDTNVEPSETFNVVLSGVSANASIGTSVGIGTILNDDSPAAISIDPVTINNVLSGTTTATFTVSLSAVPSNSVMVRYATSDLTAIDGVDYEGTSGTLTFNAGGGVTQTIPVTILGDSNVDDVDTFLVTLSNPINATIQTGQALGTIIPAKSAPSVAVNDVTQQEGISGTSDFVFTVTLSSPATEEATVAFATADDTATAADNDYEPQSGTITFAIGTSSRTITIAVNGDMVAEPTESFLVNLTAGNGAVGNVQGRGTIVDDDGTPTLTISDARVAAGSGVTNAVFTVTLSGLVTQQVNVGFATADNEAVAGIDYLAKTGNLTFSPGGPTFQEIVVTILGSLTPQPDKTFFVNLSSQVPASVVIGDELGVGTIITQGLSISDANVVEGNASTTSAIFTVTLSRQSDLPVTVVYSTADGTATTADSDYVSSGAVLTFAAGVTSLTVTVPVVGDATPEGNETFSVNLSGAVGAPLFRSQGIGTILNDDGAKMAIRLALADLFGTPLPLDTPLDVGEHFLLQVFVADVQADPSGVFQAYLDVTYQDDVVMVNGSAQFGPGFQGPTGSFLPGHLDDFGAFRDVQPPADPSAELLLLTVPFKAIDVGVVIFDGFVTSLGLGHQNLLYFSDIPVEAEDVNVVDTSTNIGANVITIGNDTKAEGAAMVFTVTRFLPTGATATVEFTTVDGTATAGQDYVAKSGTLTFVGGGPETQTITVQVNDDAIDEPNESFSLVLGNAVGATASNLPGTGTITDNDGAPTLAAGNGSGVEGNNVVFTVSLSSVSGQTVTVAYATAPSAGGNAATAGADYTPVSGTLTFNPGIVQQFVTVAALNDIALESNETFQLVLSSPSNATLGTAQGQGTIVDVPPAGISGFVYVDLNNNGIKESNESGIAGAIVSVVRASNNDTQSTATGADGSYSFVGLFPDTYTIKETQPGFFTDGRDTRFGVDSPVNDQFTGVVLAPMAAETGFHFGEVGIRSEFISAFINRRALFATAAVSGIFGPTLNMPGTVLNLQSGDIWVSFDGGWQGLRTIQALFDASQGGVTMRLYNNALQEVASSSANASGAVLLFNGQAGLPYFLRISGSNPNVTVEISETPLPGSLSPTGGESSGESGSSGSSSSSATSPPSRFASSAPTTPPAQPMIAPAMEPLVSSEASDEALAEDDDWVLESLLA